MIPDELPQPLPIPPFPSGDGAPPLRDSSAASLLAPNHTSASLRQSPPLEGKRPRVPLYDAFTLGYGDEGAKIHKGQLEWCVTTHVFEKKIIGSVDVNGLIEQKAIEGVKVLDIADSTATDLDPWIQLAWWGDVYAVVELDVGTGRPVALTLEGPDEPELKPIPRLDEELSRGSGSGNAERYGFFVRIGKVEESTVINQDHLGNLQYHVAFVPEGGGSSSGGSGESGGSSAGSGSGGASGGSSGSSKDTAIHPAPDGKYRKWYAMEATEVLFFDFQDYELTCGQTTTAIDPIVAFSCEPGSLRAFPSPDIGQCNAIVKGYQLILSAKFSAKKRRQKTSVMLKGLRRGFANVRLGFATFEDFVDNECRLNPRMTREQIIAALAEKGVTE